ncbi:hypothetical protein CC1G_15032 [Coprinopsis cinerea okayama7|uniref:Uncharacterized protein n=1 Tax=Coprinopsis cinerea (strain Okayama-7 / 130 / ATCC MYA-4618 / FGSC 9003) TaxID=240176 RepID=D6RPD9_COPC7|nr:hypothetical protein CC1G_15032 [Coprinopsis cinerea okayama7\|eukprot:XP_002910701.1 hypothetical protein CC1G_15032 [Coprinopsis cinerea okayama7\
MRSVEKNKKKNVDNHSGVLLKSVPNTRPTLVQPKKPKPQKIKGTCQKTTPIATSSFNVPYRTPSPTMKPMCDVLALVHTVHNGRHW